MFNDLLYHYGGSCTLQYSQNSRCGLRLASDTFDCNRVPQGEYRPYCCTEVFRQGLRIYPFFRTARPPLRPTQPTSQQASATLSPGVQLHLNYPHVFAFYTRITSLVFNYSQCPGDRQRLRDLPQRAADGAMGPTESSHSVQCFFHCRLDHFHLRDQPRHHPYCKTHGWLLVRTYHLAHTGLFFYVVISPSALPSIRHSTKPHWSEGLTHSPNDTVPLP